MKGTGALLVLGLIVAAGFIALAIAQGEVNSYITNVTNTYNVTINNTAGVSIPQDNITGGINLPYENLTGTIILDYGNLSGSPLLSQDNITGGITLPAPNVTSGAFGAGNFSFDSMVTLTYLNVTNTICLNSDCTATILFNGTHIIINNSAA